jgi:hypothetical protein
MNYEVSFLKSLVLTVFIETLVLWILTRFFEKKKAFPVSMILIAGFFASFATLPYLWFIVPVFIKEPVFYSIICELFAVVLESFILFGFLKIAYNKCLLFSAVCNIVSFSTGLLIHYTFPEFL